MFSRGCRNLANHTQQPEDDEQDQRNTQPQAANAIHSLGWFGRRKPQVSQYRIDDMEALPMPATNRKLRTPRVQSGTRTAALPSSLSTAKTITWLATAMSQAQSVAETQEEELPEARPEPMPERNRSPLTLGKKQYALPRIVTKRNSPDSLSGDDGDARGRVKSVLACWSPTSGSVSSLGSSAAKPPSLIHACMTNSNCFSILALMKKPSRPRSSPSGLAGS